MYHHFLLVIHLLAATVWIGGHLILATRYLPEAIKTKDLEKLKIFKDKFESIGMPSLITLVITGILMAYDYDVTFTKWFSFSNGIEKVISIKLILFITSLTLAISAQLFIFPKLSPKKHYYVTILIIVVTFIAISMLVLGSLIRIGGI